MSAYPQSQQEQDWLNAGNEGTLSPVKVSEAQERREMMRALDMALWEIQTELSSNSAEEIAGNPMLRHKQQFVARMQRKLERWRDR
jgi:hypothetical protein